MPTRRLIPAVSLSPVTPSLAGGEPRVSKYTASYTSGWTVLQGVGHVRVFPDPDPTWSGSAWVNPPPSAPAGSHFMRWTARSLPDPATTGTGGEYPLGIRGSADGTSGLPSGCGNWTSQGDFTLNWNSDYPFKPRVASYTHHGKDGTTVKTPIAVHFHPHFVQHMWCDFGTVLNMPFTFMVVAVFTRFHRVNDIQNVLDGGRDPTPSIDSATRLAWLSHGVPGRRKLPLETGVNLLGYRTALRVHPERMVGFNDQSPTTRKARVPYAHSLRPKVIFGVYNGNSSFFGVYGNELKFPGLASIRTVKLSNLGAQRFAVLGRQNGVIDTDKSSSMVVFEIRCWDAALTTDQLDQHYRQMASTWRFVEHT